MLWRKKPAKPPSSAQLSSVSQKFCPSLREFYKLKNFALLLMSFNLVWGVYTTMGSMVSSITSPFGFTPKDNSYFRNFFIVFGVISSGVLGALLDKKKTFKSTHIFLTVGLCLSGTSAYLGLIA